MSLLNSSLQKIWLGLTSLQKLLEQVLQKLVLSLLIIYSYCLSPLLRPRCCYRPSCSKYIYEAINMHGLRKGFKLGAWRLLHCHPGKKLMTYDPVPNKIS